MQRRMEHSVWTTGGCESWYLDARGRNTTVWPGTTAQYRRATRRVRLDEYDLVRAPRPAPAGEPAASATASATVPADAPATATAPTAEVTS
jgi:hypothetical protein